MNSDNTASLHTCEACSKEFELPKLETIRESLDRAGFGNRMEVFTKVACPYCGKSQYATERRFFGFLGPRALTFLLVSMVAGMAILAIWTSQIDFSLW